MVMAMRTIQRDEQIKARSFRAAFKAEDARKKKQVTTWEEKTERLGCVRCANRGADMTVPAANGSRDAVCVSCATVAEIATVARPV
jgi:hypothetical protein